MGMFDYLKCHYPLPVAGFEGRTWQTKDMAYPFLHLYEIKDDGTIWFNAEPLSDLNREINFYDFADPLADLNDSSVDAGWIEFRATFVSGHVKSIEVVENQPSNKVIKQ